MVGSYGTSCLSVGSHFAILNTDHCSIFVLSFFPNFCLLLLFLSNCFLCHLIFSQCIFLCSSLLCTSPCLVFYSLLTHSLPNLIIPPPCLLMPWSVVCPTMHLTSCLQHSPSFVLSQYLVHITTLLTFLQQHYLLELALYTFTFHAPYPPSWLGFLLPEVHHTFQFNVNKNLMVLWQWPLLRELPLHSRNIFCAGYASLGNRLW